MREKVREMFTHAYDGYMRYAFPHDELKPLSRSWTDSLVELGTVVVDHTSAAYVDFRNEGTRSGSYRIVKQSLGGGRELGREELLDMRSKHKHDKYCR